MLVVKINPPAKAGDAKDRASTLSWAGGLEEGSWWPGLMLLLV